MFSIVGNINFLYELKNFDSFTNAILTVFDASIGNFDTSMFEVIEDDNLRLIG